MSVWGWEPLHGLELDLTSDSPADQRFSMSVKERERGAARERVVVSDRRKRIVVVAAVVVGKCIFGGRVVGCVVLEFDGVAVFVV